MYIEIVPGLGETLVGNYPGDALTCVVNKNDLNSFKILSFPSKSLALRIPRKFKYNGVLICRSDSNAEDLAGFAGAGLFDSIPSSSYDSEFNEYDKEKLIVDEGFRSSVIVRLCETCKLIENQLSCAQDIEGVVDKNGKIFIVQSRVQV
eukprot:TRINITY_DN6577_c3_g1_i1.p1 TRINITY_DN6577_c3_g1~~TRINITY_DN6577_c3_g1_i1.p1  ORF type:complete len:149 (+),score=16.16 TRINITY_DN6577_c3_g1_i1:324-770(+)